MNSPKIEAHFVNEQYIQYKIIAWIKLIVLFDKAFEYYWKILLHLFKMRCSATKGKITHDGIKRGSRVLLILRNIFSASFLKWVRVFIYPKLYFLGYV